MRASPLGDWHRARPVQRFGYLIGGALILVGLAHLADPRRWSWRSASPGGAATAMPEAAEQGTERKGRRR
jgi:hypothetical protein